MPPKNTQANSVETDATAADQEVITQSVAETPAIEPEATHRIAGQSPTGFWRAGRHWPPEGIEVNKADFTDEQWAALEGELKLSIKPL